ncbi:Peroxiredoxin [Oceanospirillum multiglobuliferum]|uniref:Alkyl hydroperoxide reductase n=1 Tax=Oceanospirillum multiglobuliferum TaxID=64969 RepID=A0A1T4RRQ5_9GAMM|nr:peroxiredoxin-like family protein [Oceanospirillum multiglobuliferum]OPX54703.1 alkyl hydroperoxide reductase [Oceanospirillum multiglobuliferum]SKA18644.1 Peroxiredoxin [Oceanospirillum multiglobuliferum]
MQPLYPRQSVPELNIETLAGHWSLSSQQPENFTLLVFYRGYHCPICRSYLTELNRLSADFAERGITLLALSSDNQARAELSKGEWSLDKLNIGYGLSQEQAEAWGLYRSAGKGKTSIGVEEPAEFSEPALYLIRPDGTLYWGSVSTMPFARPNFKEMLGAVDFVLKNDYPARGELR